MPWRRSRLGGVGDVVAQPLEPAIERRLRRLEAELAAPGSGSRRRRRSARRRRSTRADQSPKRPTNPSAATGPRAIARAGPGLPLRSPDSYQRLRPDEALRIEERQAWETSSRCTRTDKSCSALDHAGGVEPPDCSRRRRRGPCRAGCRRGDRRSRAALAGEAAQSRRTTAAVPAGREKSSRPARARAPRPSSDRDARVPHPRDAVREADLAVPPARARCAHRWADPGRSRRAAPPPAVPRPRRIDYLEARSERTQSPTLRSARRRATQPPDRAKGVDRAYADLPADHDAMTRRRLKRISKSTTRSRPANRSPRRKGCELRLSGAARGKRRGIAAGRIDPAPSLQPSKRKPYTPDLGAEALLAEERNPRVGALVRISGQMPRRPRTTRRTPPRPGPAPRAAPHRVPRGDLGWARVNRRRSPPAVDREPGQATPRPLAPPPVQQPVHATERRPPPNPPKRSSRRLPSPSRARLRCGTQRNHRSVLAQSAHGSVATTPRIRQPVIRVRENRVA